MITTKINGTQYSTLNKEIIKFHIENKFEIAFVERALNYNQIDNGYYEYINDITQDELQKGEDLVFNFCKENNCLDLFYDYKLAIAKNNDEILQANKLKKKHEINKARDLTILNGFDFKGIPYQTDLKSINDIANTSQSTRDAIKWISKDNEIVEFTNSDFKDFFNQLNKFIEDNVIKARELKNEVFNAKTLKDLEKIEW